jgi:isochorismate synthase
MFVLPFEQSDKGRVVVPKTTIVRSGERTRVLGEAEILESIGSVEPDPPRGRVVAEVPTPDEWARLVERAVDEIDAGVMSKVVLARRVDVAITRGRAWDLLTLLAERFPSTYLYGWADEGTVFLGASPELLVDKEGSAVRSFPLAGSAPRGDGRADDERIAAALLSASKEGQEHRIVVEEVAGILKSETTTLRVPDRPSVVRLPNIQHLGTEIVGTARAGTGFIDLVSKLHPTPAVAGTPTETARRFIHDTEPFDRGWYAGALGWADANGDGEAIVALRGTMFRDSIARVYAGAGIVRGSIPASEVAETEAKLAAILDVLVEAS